MIAIELCLPPKVNASGFERAAHADAARGAHADDVAFGPAFVVAPGTPLRLVAAEQPAVREDHPALEGMAQPRARRGAGTALTQDCAKRGNIGKFRAPK